MEFSMSLPDRLQQGAIWRCRGSHGGQYRRVRQVNRRNVVVEPTGRGARHRQHRPARAGGTAGKDKAGHGADHDRSNKSLHGYHSTRNRPAASRPLGRRRHAQLCIEHFWLRWN